MIVRGENVLGYINEGGVWKPFVCLRSLTLNIATEFMETSVRGAGVNATFIPTKNNFTGSAEGVVSLNETGKLTLPELQAKQLNHELLTFRMERTDEGANVYTSEFNAYISNSTDTGNYDGLDTFSLELRGTGKLTQVFTPTVVTNNNPDMRYEYPGIGGETGFTDASLINKYIISVDKDGIGRAKIITTGTPVAKEVKYDATTGTFEFAQPFEADEYSVIIYRDI